MTKTKVIGNRKNKDSMKVDRQPTKEEKKVVDWLRTHVPTKKTKFLHSHVVEYFIGRKAVDVLLNDSPWSAQKQTETSTISQKSQASNSEQQQTDTNVQKPSHHSTKPNSTKKQSFDTSNKIVFYNREDATDFLDDMLKHKFFHRAEKVTVTTEKSSNISKSCGQKKSDDSDPVTTRRRKVENLQSTEEIMASKDSNHRDENGSGETALATKKRKIRLDMHLDQIFCDSQDAYVWLYNPHPWYYWIIGSLIVLGIIVLCLFPLWPHSLRLGAHYLSLTAAGFMAFIIGLAAFKYLFFALFYVLSAGRLRFWVFPNLTEDCGFFESFVPFYDYTFLMSDDVKKTKRRKTKTKKTTCNDSDETEHLKKDNLETNNNIAEDQQQSNDKDTDDSQGEDNDEGKISQAADFEVVDAQILK